MTNNRILEKVKKLLALAQDPSAAPNEAETAGRQAASLMARYNLSIADLDDAALAAEWDLIQESMVGCRPGKKNPTKVPPWIGFLAYGIKLYTRTRCVQSGPLVYFKGPRQDVELAHWMLKTLIELAYRASQGQANPNAFRNGFASAVQDRLRRLAKQRQEVETEETGTALVPLNNKLQEALDRAFGPEPGAKKSTVTSSSAGRQAGMSASLPLNRPIAQTGRKLLA